MKSYSPRLSAASALGEKEEVCETQWHPVQQTLRYNIRRVLDPANDPDCVRAWRNGHGSIDFQERSGCGQVPIFALRTGMIEIEAGDWIVKWEGGEYGWVETDRQVRLRFDQYKSTHD